MTTQASTQTARVQRVGYGLSAGAVVSIVLILVPSNDAVRLAKVTPIAALVLLVVAVVGVLAAKTSQAGLYLAAGGLALVAAVLQMVQFGQNTNVIGGNGSTAGLLAGFGIGFCGLAYAARPSRNSE